MRETCGGGESMDVEEARGGFLAGLLGRYVRPEAAILEIGCKGGKNIDPLYRAGMIELTGIEESPERVSQLEARFPDIWGRANVIQGPLDVSMGRFADGEFDLVFSVGYFEEDADYEHLFDEMARVAGKYVITIEDERELPRRSGARDFGKTFESRGLRQVEEIDVAGKTGLESFFYCRVFKKS